MFIDYLLCGQDQVVFPIHVGEIAQHLLKVEEAVTNLLSRASWKVRELSAKITVAMLEEADEFREFITTS